MTRTTWLALGFFGLAVACSDNDTGFGGDGLATDTDAGESLGDTDPAGDNADEDEDEDDGLSTSGASAQESTGAPADTDDCAAEMVDVALEAVPVDIVLVIDTSSTMDVVSSAIEQHLDGALAASLAGSDVDYRVIALASYGGGPDLCIGPPLGAGSCSPVAPLAHSERFYHYDKMTGSLEMLDNIIAWYGTPDDSGLSPMGWKQWLRPGARTVFLAVTDALSMSNDPSLGTAFDTQLLALDPVRFGSLADRRYVFHSITGLMAQHPPTAGWLPTQPIVNEDCVGFDGKEPGQPLQEVSRLSGGLRYPICAYPALDVIFTAIAETIEGTASGPGCVFAIPEAPEGNSVDTDTIELDVFPSDGGAGMTFHQVPTPEACEPTGFYVHGLNIHLCAESCLYLRDLPGASMRIRYGCETDYEPVE